MRFPKLSPMVVPVVLVLCFAAACSEGQVGLEGDISDSTMQMDDMGNMPADMTMRPTDTTTSPDMNTGVPDQTMTTMDMTTMMDTTTPQDCVSGSKRCSSAGHVESCNQGMWVLDQVCNMGCSNSTCSTGGSLTGDCTNPVPLVLNTPTTGTTDTFYNPNTWLNECNNSGSAPLGTETVLRLDVDQAMMLQFDLTAKDNVFFAMYIRGECTNSGSQLRGACTASEFPGGSASYKGLFGPGTYYVIVDSFAESGTGEFEIIARQAPMDGCENTIPIIIDATNGPTTVTGDTAQGAKSAINQQTTCNGNDAFVSYGNEVLYTFGLREKRNVQINVQAIEPMDSQMAIYIRDECDNKFAQVFCQYAGEGSTTFSTELDPGQYFLFVDDYQSSNNDGPQSFELTMTYN